jgi:hypothetical protein
MNLLSGPSRLILYVLGSLWIILYLDESQSQCLSQIKLAQKLASAGSNGRVIGHRADRFFKLVHADQYIGVGRTSISRV